MHYLCVLLLMAGPITAPLQMVTAEDLVVGQNPSPVTVMRGERANLSCHFEVESGSKYGVQWFKATEGVDLRLSIGDGPYLVIAEVAVEDAGVYYCEVSVSRREPSRGNGTQLIVLAPPSAPQLLLRVPSDPAIEQWALLCVTGGFHPNLLTMTWTHQSADSDQPSMVRNCTIQPAHPCMNQSASLNLKTLTRDWMGHSSITVIQNHSACLQVTDSSKQEVYLISVLSLPPRQSLDAGITYTCSVQDHPALTTALSAFFIWNAAPNEVIGCLNILKMCVLSGLTTVFSTIALQHLCEKKRTLPCTMK